MTAMKHPVSLNVAEETWPQIRAERMAAVANGGMYGRIIRNPYLGYIVHAPPDRKRAGKYFDESVTAEELWQRQKDLRNTPAAGWFHPRPGRYSRLHFRNIKDDYFKSKVSVLHDCVGPSESYTARRARASPAEDSKTSTTSPSSASRTGFDGHSRHANTTTRFRNKGNLFSEGGNFSPPGGDFATLPIPADEQQQQTCIVRVKNSE